MVAPGGKAPSWTDEYLVKYKQAKLAEMQEGKQEVLLDELKNLKGFMEEVSKGMVDTSKSEQASVMDKIKVLEDLI